MMYSNDRVLFSYNKSKVLLQTKTEMNLESTTLMNEASQREP